MILTIEEKLKSVNRAVLKLRHPTSSTVDAELSCMLKPIALVAKEGWRDIIFIITIHLFLLSLYMVVYYNLSHFPATLKPRYPVTNRTIAGVCI